MQKIKIDSKNTKMIAHRGLSGIELENTASAFVAAGNRSYFGIETDIHATTDNKFVVIHDETTERVSDENINVEEVTYDEARKVQLKSKYGEGRIDLKIPNLQEYIDICKRYEKKCILEIKNTFSLENIKKLIEEIKSMDYLENVVFISFSFDNMKMLRELLPDQELQYLCKECSEEVIDNLNKYNLDLDIYHGNLTKDIVDKVHSNNHLVNCWTVDDKERAEELVAWGVDFITTNILE